MLVLHPPHGEFVLMNFHIGALRHEGQIPFRVTPMLSKVSELAVAVTLRMSPCLNNAPPSTSRSTSSKRSPRDGFGVPAHISPDLSNSELLNLNY